MTTQTPDERIAELEKEVKCLTRLVKELVAKEKVYTKRLQMVAQDLQASKKSLKALDLSLIHI